MFKLLIALILLSFSHVSRCQENTVVETIPFELTTYNNILVDVVLNQKDTLPLMFHTAVSDVSLIKDVTKNLASISWNEQDTVSSWGGESTSRRSNKNDLLIGDFSQSNIPIWECEQSGRMSVGKFGPSLFEGKSIEVDFDQKVIKIYNSLPAKAANYEKLELTSQNSSMFIQGTSILGKDSIANIYLIHSGYSGSILYDDTFVKSNEKLKELEVIKETELKDSYGNIIKVKKSKLPSFLIGQHEFTNMPVGFFEGSVGRQKMSVLGGDLLKRFNFILDAEHKYIYLKTNGLSSDPYSEL